MEGTQNIYITSDEEIKKGYYLDLTHNIIMKSVFYSSSDKNCKKIILTTDPELIADGVQAIPDEFLEWFVAKANDSGKPIDIVEVEKEIYEEIVGDDFQKNVNYYAIIIPKEDLSYTTKMGINVSDEMVRAVMIPKDFFGKEEPKQETLEETAERISPIQQVINFITENFQKEGEARQLSMDLLKKWCEVKLLNEESKWQQERSYSEEDLRDAFFSFPDEWATFEEWFKQFKKK